LIASAVQLVEHNVVGTGVIISALRDTYAIVRTGHLDASFSDHIENGISPVILDALDEDELRGIIDKGAAYVLELSGVDADRDASQTMVPDWLRDLNRKTSPRLDHPFRTLAGRFHLRCDALGRNARAGRPADSRNRDHLAQRQRSAGHRQ
jgi:hypothetical protein